MEEYELLRAFCLGCSLMQKAVGEYCEKNFIEVPTFLLIPKTTEMLRQIASGEITLRETPESNSEQDYYFTNLIIKSEKELAQKIEEEMGPETVKDSILIDL